MHGIKSNITKYLFCHTLLLENVGRDFVMRAVRCICRSAGYIALAFGAGILLTYFLPCSVLVVIESLIIISAGVFYFTNI